MKDPEVLAFPKDGPRVAMRKMKEKGISSIFVVDRNRRLLGYVLMEEAAKAADRGDPDLTKIMRTDCIKVPPESTLNELFEKSATSVVPLVVVNEAGRILGIIIRGVLLAGLVKENYAND